MQIQVFKIDTWQKFIFYHARHKADFTSEAAFYEAYAYWHERPVVGWYIQRQFIKYMHSGGECLPEAVVNWSLDVLAERIWY